MIRASIMCVLFAGVAAAQTAERAEARWRAHDYRAAEHEWETLIKLVPGNVNYKVRLGRLLLERFNPGEAGNLFQEALKQDPKNAGALLGLALVAADGFSGSASDLARKALAADPKLTEAQELLARLALEDNQPDKAREEAASALKLDGKSLTAEAIEAAAELMEHKSGDEWLNRIGSEHPHDGRGYETIGYFLQINRRYEDAIAYFKRAISVEPDLWSAHSQLGLNLMRLGREEAARKELELCYQNGYRNNETVNTLRLMDSYSKFKTFRTSSTTLRLNQNEAEELKLYMEPELRRAIAAYAKKYDFALKRPVQLEVYPDHEDFAVRTMGMPGLGALGVTFEDVVAMDSPSGRPPGEFHWASTMWHELSHVYVLSITGQRVPRWFTEGLAVHEETQASPDWGDRLTPDVVTAIRDKKLLPVAELDRGFIHPKYPGQVIVSYFQAGRICDFISKKWGERKLLDMVHAFAKTDSTPEVIGSQLGLKPAEFDKQFFLALDEATAREVKGLEQWKKNMRSLNAALASKKYDDVLHNGPAVRDVYPEYVEGGSAYQALAEAARAKNDTATELDNLQRYSRAGGRDPKTLKQLATLLSKQGKRAEAIAVLERLIYIAPLDAELHTQLGELDLVAGDATGASREYRALLAGKAQDQASAHYGLARALRLSHKDAEARDELLESLEAAPNFKPAQKMLLEMNPSPTD